MKTQFLFSIAALSEIEKISHVNTRDDGREPTSYLDHFIRLQAFPIQHYPPKRAAKRSPHKENPLAIQCTW